jgi:hypothetical protein
VKTREEYFKDYPPIEPPVIGPHDVAVGPQIQPVLAFTSYWHQPANRFEIVDLRLRWEGFSRPSGYYVTCEVFSRHNGWQEVWGLDTQIDGATHEERADSITRAFRNLAVFVNLVLI